MAPPAFLFGIKFYSCYNKQKGDNMNYAEIKKYDIANGPGVRVSLFVSGCRHHCKECFNQIAWDFNYGKEFTKEVEDEILEALAPDYIEGITLLGGEPFEAENQRGLLPFLKRVRATYPNKTIWAFSGFRLDDELLQPSRGRCEVTDEMLSLIDTIVDGRFILEQKDISLRFRGSKNQRIIDVKETLKQNKIVYSPYN